MVVMAGIAYHPAIEAQWHEPAYIDTRSFAYGMLGNGVVAKIPLMTSCTDGYGIELQIRHLLLVAVGAGTLVGVIMRAGVCGQCPSSQDKGKRKTQHQDKDSPSCAPA